MAVVPEAGAEEDLLNPGAGVLRHRAQQRARQEDQRRPLGRELVEAEGEEHRAQAPDQGEGPVEHAAAVLELAPCDDHEDRLHHAAQEGHNEEEPEELVEIDAPCEEAGYRLGRGGFGPFYRCSGAGTGALLDQCGHTRPSFLIQVIPLNGGYHIISTRYLT